MALSGKQIALLKKLAAAGERGEWAGVDPRTVNTLVKKHYVRIDAHPSGLSNLRMYRITPKGLTFLNVLPDAQTPAAKQAEAAFGVGDLVIIRRDVLIQRIPSTSGKLRELQVNGTVGKIVEFTRYEYSDDVVHVQFGETRYGFTENELEIWKPQPVFDVEDDTIYSIAPIARYEVGAGGEREPEIDALKAENDRLRSALEPFEALAREALKTLPDHAMPHYTWYQLNDVRITIAHFHAVIEALNTATVET